MVTFSRPQRPGGAKEPAASALSSPELRGLLVPLDGSHLAEAALPVASRLADAYGATITLLHVIERHAPTRVHGQRHLMARQESDVYLAGVAQRLAGPGRNITCHTHDVPVADVAESITVHAEEHAIDLTVMCTHGEGGIRDALWGSIAQQVLQHSSRPVLLVRVRTQDPTPTFTPRTVMVTLDGTVAAEAALPSAASLADRLAARLRLVLVVPTIETVSAEQVLTARVLPSATRLLLDMQEEQAAAYLERLAETTRAMDVVTSTEVRRGEAVAQLATDTAEHADGLVVIATHGRAGLQAIWSQSVAARLLTRTRAPVLLVPIVE